MINSKIEQSLLNASQKRVCTNRKKMSAWRVTIYSSSHKKFHLLPACPPPPNSQPQKRMSYELVSRTRVPSHPVLSPPHSQPVAKWFHHFPGKGKRWFSIPLVMTSHTSHFLGQSRGARLSLKHLASVFFEECSSHWDVTRGPGLPDPSVLGNGRGHPGHATV